MIRRLPARASAVPSSAAPTGEAVRFRTGLSMPETYEVQTAEHKADKPDTGYGPMQVINLSLKTPDGTVKQAEWFTKKSSSVPQPGVQLVGEIRSGQYGLRFKKVASAAFGPRPEDPQRQKRIVRQHSQEMAVRTLALFNDLDILDASQMGTRELFDLIKKTTDWFEKDVESAAS
jgi:hypothetical protein